ncbi:MAG: imidazole glycerol phosphate synthase subunit HisH [Proteobacteria bacterium]|nr:imidazole glycerol phosphate synthase subunit HisH [Pseudomonadota bacterium]
MGRSDVTVVRTGSANLASVLAALRRLGAVASLTEEPSEVQRATHLVLPGVGTLAAAMRKLTEDRLVEPLRERVAAGRPTLAICLGMQMLLEGSEESDGVEGLCIVPGIAERFPKGVRVPQLGWNRIEVEAEAEILRDGYVYFANSYRLVAAPEGWCVASSDYGGRFVAAVERGSVIGCQFHPELSGEFGLGIIERWFKG